MENMLFVVTEMRMGGREQVVARISDGLLKSGINSDIFSVWQTPSFFKTKLTVYYSTTEHDTGETSTQVTSADKTVIKKTITPVIKVAVNNKLLGKIIKSTTTHAFLQRRRIQQLLELISQNGYSTIVLTDLTNCFAHAIRQKFPNIKIIGWTHMQADAFFKVQYPEFRTELLKNMRHLDKIITLTNQQAQDYNHVTNIPTTAIANPVPNVSNDKYTTHHNHMQLVVVARIDIHHKGLDYLVEVLEKFNSKYPYDWQLDFVGSGDAEEFNKIIAKHNLSNKINLRGALSGDELEAAYNSADLFLMTSRYEGLPLTIGEAFAHGVPVISFDLDGVKEFSGESSGAKLISQYDTTSFANELHKLLTNPDTRLKMSESALQQSKNFSINNIVEKWKQAIV